MTRPATRAAMPSFRLVETLDIAMILSIFVERGFARQHSGLQYRGHEQVGHETL
jgi:hypothetical protein